mgnify:CR=1 FL=1
MIKTGEVLFMKKEKERKKSRQKISMASSVYWKANKQQNREKERDSKSIATKNCMIQTMGSGILDTVTRI